MTREAELWGAPSMLLKQHGERIDDHVAERIEALAAGDSGGVALWRDLPARIERLRVSPRRTN